MRGVCLVSWKILVRSSFCEFVGFGECGCVSVGCCYDLMEMGGDDACVDMVG